jgi:hypothetical protein
MGLIALIKAQDGKFQTAKHWPTDMPITALEFDERSETLYAGQEDGNVQVIRASWAEFYLAFDARQLCFFTVQIFFDRLTSLPTRN